MRRLTVGTIPSTAPTANRYDLLTKVVQTIAIAVPASIQVADCGIYRCGAISYAEVVESYLETITWRVFATYFYRLVYILLSLLHLYKCRATASVPRFCGTPAGRLVSCGSLLNAIHCAPEGAAEWTDACPMFRRPARRYQRNAGEGFPGTVAQTGGERLRSCLPSPGGVCFGERESVRVSQPA